MLVDDLGRQLVTRRRELMMIVQLINCIDSRQMSASHGQLIVKRLCCVEVDCLPFGGTS